MFNTLKLYYLDKTFLNKFMNVSLFMRILFISFILSGFVLFYLTYDYYPSQFKTIIALFIIFVSTLFISNTLLKVFYEKH